MLAYKVVSPYHPTFVSDLKRYTSYRRFDYNQKAWIVGQNDQHIVKKLVDFYFANSGTEISAVDVAPYSESPKAQYDFHVAQDARSFSLKIPFISTRRFVEDLHFFGIDFSVEDHVYTFRIIYLPNVLKLLDAFFVDFSVDGSVWELSKQIEERKKVDKRRESVVTYARYIMNNFQVDELDDGRVRYRPHVYQRKAIEYALNHKRALLMMEMGLGKTSVALSVVAMLHQVGEVHKVLVVAPKLVAQTVWADEVKKWDFCRGIDVAVAIGTVKQRKAALESDALITTINRENTQWLIDEKGKDWDYDMIIIDESSSFKSPTSKRFKSLMSVVFKSERLLELTGTPRPKCVEDLWSQTYMIDHGNTFGKTIWEFRNNWEYKDNFNWVIDRADTERVYLRMEDLSMSMKAEDWLSVPEMIDITHTIQFDSKTMLAYKNMGENVQEEYEEKVATLTEEKKFGELKSLKMITPTVILGKHVQFTGGTLYKEAGSKEYDVVHNYKIDALNEIADSTEKPLLIFYWFQSEKEIITESLKKRKDGAVSDLSTPEDIAKWNKGEIRYAVCQPSAMGHGLNLQSGSNTLVWYSLTWNLEIFEQANARLHRQGQQEKVFAHYLIAKGTADEDILMALKRKGAGQAELMQKVKAKIQSK